MTATIQVILNGRQLTTWDDFHTECAIKFGFPKFYGHNLDAWVDCMSDIGGGLMNSELQSEEGFLIVVEDSATWAEEAPEIVAEFRTLLEAVHSRFKESISAKQIAVVFR